MQLTSFSPEALTTRKPSLDTFIRFLEMEETPFTSVVQSSNKARAAVHQAFIDKLKSPRVSGTSEGYAGGAGGNQSRRESFLVPLQRFFKEYGVSDLQQIIATRGGDWVVRDEVANSRAKALREVKRDIEAVALLDRDAKLAGDVERIESRGAIKWLDSTMTPDIPDSVRCPAAQRKTGVATLTETHLRDMVTSLSKQGAGKRFDAFVGADYRNNVDAMIAYRDPGNITDAGRYRVVNNGQVQELVLTVDVLRFSGGKLVVHTDHWLNYDETTESGDPKVALFTSLAQWEMIWLEPINIVETITTAGGFHEKMRGYGGLACYAPRANGVIRQ